MKYSVSPKMTLLCSTWNMSFVLIGVALALMLSSCQKKDQKPELKDSIYKDMLQQLAEAEGLMNELQTKALDVRKTGAEARINSAIKKKAERQAIEFEKAKEKMAQLVSYWKIRSFGRLKHVRALASKQVEPYVADPREWDVYQSEKKLRMAKNAWDLRARFKETGFDYNSVLMGEKPADVKKEEPRAKPPDEDR